MSENANEWVRFDPLELIDIKSRPRKAIRRFYEINPLGQVRYLDRAIPKYRDMKLVSYNGKTFFMSPVGWSAGNLIVTRFLISDLVKRFFGSKLDAHNCSALVAGHNCSHPV